MSNAHREENKTVDQEYIAEKWMLGDDFFAHDDRESGTQNQQVAVAEQADKQLLHALLLGHHDSEEKLDALLEHSMASVRAQGRAKALMRVPSTISRKLMPVMSIAASVFIVSLVFFTSLPSNTAVADIDNIIARLAAVNDRLYSLNIEDEVKNDEFLLDHSTPDADIKDRSPVERAPIERALLRKGQLYLRGDTQFVLMGERDDGTTFIKGSNQFESWQISGAKQRLRRAPIGQIKLPIFGRSRDLVFLNLPKTLASLKDSHHFEVSSGEVIAGVNGAWSKIVATKVDREEKGLAHVELYYEPTSFDLERIVFKRIPMQSNTKKVNLRLDLISKDALPNAFFDAETHSKQNTDARNDVR